ncbi:MAG: hypothetical protein ACTSRC_22470 [Candidatus Helarchaeota archaeon]
MAVGLFFEGRTGIPACRIGKSEKRQEITTAATRKILFRLINYLISSKRSD